jgi:hypothetical protein
MLEETAICNLRGQGFNGLRVWGPVYLIVACVHRVACVHH